VSAPIHHTAYALAPLSLMDRGRIRNYLALLFQLSCTSCARRSPLHHRGGESGPAHTLLRYETMTAHTKAPVRVLANIYRQQWRVARCKRIQPWPNCCLQLRRMRQGCMHGGDTGPNIITTIITALALRHFTLNNCIISDPWIYVRTSCSICYAHTTRSRMAAWRALVA
jgi:hypothetical protein